MSNDAPQKTRRPSVGFWWLITAIGIILAVIANEVAEYSQGGIPACYLEGVYPQNPTDQNSTCSIGGEHHSFTH